MKHVVEKVLNRETVMYVFFGVLTTALSFVMFELGTFLGFNVFYANTFSTVIAVSFAFVTNKLWVFNSKSFRFFDVLSEFLKFCSGRLFTFLVETGLLIWLVSWLGFNKTYCKLFTSVVIIVLNYVVSKWGVFRKK